MTSGERRRLPHGGADGNQTHDLFIANEALYQLSYCPMQERDVFGERNLPSKHLISSGVGCFCHSRKFAVRAGVGP